MQTPELSSTHPLTTMFSPRTIALVGASDRSGWSHSIFRTFAMYESTATLYAVNKRGAPAHGLPAFMRCVDIPEPVDVAYLFVPAEAMIEALEDVAAAGICGAVVLTSGFAEAGEAGAAMQERLVARARELGVELLGPNSMGFANVALNRSLTAIPTPLPVLKGSVALVSQSGATLSEMIGYAHGQGIGLSFFAATGNEAMLDFCSIIDWLVDDPHTRVIGVYCESVRFPERLAAVARRALAARKAIVVLKAGVSSISAEVAKAHTGSLVGNDRVFDAACKQSGILRAASVEDLITTAGLIAYTGPLARDGVALVSLSGGACSLFADGAEPAGVSMPAFTDETQAALRAVLPDYAATLNPFDITGAAVRAPDMFEHCLRAVAADPAIGLVLCAYNLPFAGAPSPAGAAILQSIGAGMKETPVPCALVNYVMQPVSAVSRQLMADSGIPAAFGGIELVARALGRLSEWSRRLRAGAQDVPVAAVRPSPPAVKPRSEREVLDFLGGFDVPVIPARLCDGAEQAVAAAAQWGGRVALKVVSPDIAHKSDIGGVVLGVEGAAAVAAAYESIDRRVRQAAPAARIDGIVVSPMRSGGVELFVGTVSDPVWGPAIVVGLGGIWVEVLADTALRPLPVTADDVVDMLQSLRSVKLLQGFRGTVPVDLRAVAEVVVRIGDAALALGSELVSLEINPLLVDGARCEALDGLTVWREA